MLVLRLLPSPLARLGTTTSTLWLAPRCNRFGGVLAFATVIFVMICWLMLCVSFECKEMLCLNDGMVNKRQSGYLEQPCLLRVPFPSILQTLQLTFLLENWLVG